MLDFVCLAGNHSCYAARQILEDGSDKLEDVETIQYRSAWVFAKASLTDDDIKILEGTILHPCAVVSRI